MAYYWTAFDWVAYEKKTAHLSVTQHGAYFLMLKHYYQTGKPLPPNTDTILRVCRAFSEVERDAVMSVLNEFFILEDDGYHNPKADEELSKSASMMQAKSKGGQARAEMLSPERRSEIAKTAANSRWKTKDLQDSELASMPAGCLQDALQLQSQLQLHKEIESKPQRKGTRLDASFQVTDEHRAFAREHGLPSPDAEIDRFRDYWIAKPGKEGTKLDWDATFRNWLRNSKQYAKPSQPTQPQSVDATALIQQRRNQIIANGGKLN